jgi:ribonuclease HI
LYLYIVVAAEVVSMVLVVERTAQEDQEPEDSRLTAGIRTV